MSQNSHQESVVPQPQLFHVVDDGEIFCGLAQVDWPLQDPRYCRRCNLEVAQTNRLVAHGLGISFEDLTVEDMATFNEVLLQYPHLKGKSLLQVACIEHVRTLSSLSACCAERSSQDVSNYCHAG